MLSVDAKKIAVGLRTGGHSIQFVLQSLEHIFG